MTSKLFYQQAVDEVSNGTIDQALWIKVVADMPSAAKVTQQAKYIQFRAKELSLQSATTRAAGFIPGIVRLLKWAVGICVVGVVIVGAVLVIAGHVDDTRMRESAIGFGATVQAHVRSGEADSDAYQIQVIRMRRTCEAWERQRYTDRWMKGTDEQDAPAVAACDQISAELKRVLQRQ